MNEASATSPKTLAFFDGKPQELALYERFATRVLDMFPATEIQVKKTQISFVQRRMYACVSMMRAKRKAELPAAYIVVTISAPDAMTSPRVAQQTQIRSGRWTVHIVVGDETELDEELFGWVASSHLFNVGE